MATAEGLMGVGEPAELAIRVGWTIVSIATDTPGQGAGPIIGPGNKIVLADPDLANDAVTLPSNAGLGDEVIVHNDNSGVVLDIFPASGHSINGLAPNAGILGVADNASRQFLKVSATRWVVLAW